MSVGVNVAPSEIAPAAAGVHWQSAMNGVAVVVATAPQPAIVEPPAVKFTVPATLAVAMMIWGPTPKIALGSVSLIVGAVWAADALVTPTIAAPPRDSVPATSTAMSLFMVGVPLLGWVITCSPSGCR